MRGRTIVGLLLIMALAALPLGWFSSTAQGAAPKALDVRVTPNTAQLAPYQVFELTFQHANSYPDPTWDVTIVLTLTAPSGRQVAVGGFFYGSSVPQKPVLRQVKPAADAKSPPPARELELADWPCDPADLWKARYAPDELGSWSYAWTFTNPAGESATGRGSLSVVAGRAHEKGFLRLDAARPFRFRFDDGSPYYAIGTQDGVFDANHNGSTLDASAMEGPFSLGIAARPRPATPPGAMFVRGPAMNPQNRDVYFGRHARAGFNMWRFSPNNYSIKVFARPDDENAESLDHVRWEEARMVDELLLMARKYGLRNFYGIFGYTKVFVKEPQNAAGMAKVRRLIKYSVDRWGAYVDIWELLNEQHAADEWYAETIPYLKSLDPYHHPLSTSWQRPELAGIDINSPHWYDSERELQSDWVVTGGAAKQKQHGKPVVYGEQGNTIAQDKAKRDALAAQGIGGVWDPGSARRMRVRLWTAMMHDLQYVFWETSSTRDSHYMNIWIGPEERQYVKALRSFVDRLDGDRKGAWTAIDGPPAGEVHHYSAGSAKQTAVYFHHVACLECAKLKAAGQPAEHRWDHRRGQVEGLTVTIPAVKGQTGYWYDPASGAILKRFTIEEAAERQTFPVPPFEIDLALLVTDGPAPDCDGDGQANDVDEDDDNDGVPDAKDAWPLEREEWADVDADRIGDSLDADIDADGVADDLNKNGIPDNEEPDWDGDGVPTANVIPWDAFPRDPQESRDTDGDGLGDNADPDIDGDGYTNAEEQQSATDPLNPLSFPVEPPAKAAPGEGSR